MIVTLAKRFIAIVGLAAVSFTQAFGENSVGVILPMTGEFARYGERIRHGIDGKRSEAVKFLYEDEGCNPAKAVSAFHKLRAATGAQLFLGPWCGSPQVAVAALLKKTKGLAVLGSSAPERVFELSGGQMVSVQPSIEAESRFNAQEAFRLGARRVVIVFLENDFSRAHEAAFRAAFKGEVVETLVYSSPDGSALRGIATKVKQRNPDTLYIPDAFPLMHGLLRQLSNLGVSGLRLMSVYSAQSDDVVKAVGSTGNGLIISYPKIEGDALEHYPQLASEVLMYGIGACPEISADCVREKITSRYSFDSKGVLSGEIGLKVIAGDKFVWFKG